MKALVYVIALALTISLATVTVLAVMDAVNKVAEPVKEKVCLSQ